jgi:hypothetical protein
MSTIAITGIHVEPPAKGVVIVRYGLHPRLKLSIPTGSLMRMPWEEFEEVGFETIRTALSSYQTAFSEDKSELELLSLPQRKKLYAETRGFLVSQRNSDLWWVDKMEPVGDGTRVTCIGPEACIKIAPSAGKQALIAAILKLL